MSTVVDYSAGVPSASAVKNAGHVGAVRYVSDPRAEWMAGKPLSRQEADAFRAEGLNLVSNFEYSKGDAKRGFAGGVADAARAASLHTDAGGPNDAPIFFSVDWDIRLSEWNSTVVEYFRGAASVIGKQRVGIYGHSRVCAWAAEDDVIGHSSTPGKRWAWQTIAWSRGAVTDCVVLLQNVVDTASNPGPVIDGVTVDVSDVLADDYGQWNTPDPAKVTEASMQKPEYNETVQFGPNCNSRWGANVINWLIHTEQGNGTAASLAAYCSRPSSGVSYHYTVRDGEVWSIVDTDLAAWSVLDANPTTINACFAGSFAEWSREEWMAREHDIKIMAWLAVQDAHKYNLPVEVIPPPYHRAPGISDHRYVTDCLRIGTHTDVGGQFPWDVLGYWVGVYSGGIAPEPVVNMIDQEADLAKGWIGKRITDGENVCPDGVGRWAQFENAYIYWSPDTGAYAIPNHVFETYADHGWEAGELGYPVGHHTVLINPDSGEAWGDVQGFQGGAIYRRYGQPGYVMTGLIRAYWNRHGFETGEFGWPISDEQSYPGGKYQDFQYGRITWAPSSVVGTHAEDDFDSIVADKK